MIKDESKSRELFFVLRAQTGDIRAFDQLLMSVQAPLHRYISHTISNPDAADDILQNVFMIIYRKLGWLENPEAFRAWAFRIASREAFRHVKREQKFRHEDMSEVDPSAYADQAEEPAFEPELIERIPKVLAEVSPASRAVIVLHYLEEFSLSATAEILDIAPGTVRSRLAYGLAVMRKHFGVENESAADLV